MEILLLAIYSGIVWLIFFKFKLLPWNRISQVIVATIPVVGLTALILILNVVAPSSHDVRVINYVVQIIPQVTGQITEVPVQDNQFVKKGDVLFQIDSVPFSLRVRELEGKLADTRAQVGQLGSELDAARENTRSLRARLELANKRLVQNQQLVEAAAGNVFDLEAAQTDVQDLRAKVSAAVASEAQVRERLGARSGGEQAQVATILAQLEQARWELEKTNVRAMTDGYAINVQIRPGAFAAAAPFRPVMTFVQADQQLYAMFEQNELRAVEPGNEAEVAFPTLPGKILRCKVRAVIWAQGQGQLTPSGELPKGTGYLPPGRFAVELEPEDSSIFLAAGARGAGAIYTEHGKMIHLVRKVIVRFGSYMNYLVLKLH
jgi:multidrug resistance efflux pump